MPFLLHQTFTLESLQTGWIFLILLFAAGQDVSNRTISNRLLCLGFVGLFGLQFLNHSWQPLSFFLGTVISLTLWKLKFIGGGDSKLLMFLSATVCGAELPILYAFIAVSGAAQAVLWILLKKRSALPYAVAILFGALGFVLSQR